MATSYYQDPFGAPDYSAEGMPSLLSLSNLESLGRGSVAGLLDLPYMIEGMLRGDVDPRMPQRRRVVPSSEQVLATTPRMTQPTPQAGLLETAGAFMSPVPVAAVKPVAKAVGRGGKAVARMAGEEINAAMMGERGGLLGAMTPQPMRVIELGPEFQGKRPPKIENLARTSDKFLFHSSTADKAKDLRYGIEPQAGGPWVREVAQGAVEGDIDNFFENVTPLAWFSDKPEWIKAMVGRKLNKSFDKVTVDDIEKYGHLAFINKKSPSAENITYIPSEGLMEGSQSKVFDIQGNPKKAWETGLYQEGNFGQRLEPFGIERNEYVSPESIEPLLQLTGSELVQFMKLKGLLD
jgi:hypothetical protein